MTIQNTDKMHISVSINGFHADCYVDTTNIDSAIAEFKKKLSLMANSVSGNLKDVTDSKPVPLNEKSSQQALQQKVIDTHEEHKTTGSSTKGNPTQAEKRRGRPRKDANEAYA